jgi:hypothetical protein
MKILTRLIACIAVSFFAAGSTANADIVFDSNPGAGFVAFGGRSAAGSLTGDVTFLGEDYVMNAAGLSQGSTVELIDFSFVGGISQDPLSTDAAADFTGGNLIFSWFDTAGTLANTITFNVGPNNGNFVFNNLAVGAGFLIPTEGFFDISIDGAAVSTDGFSHTAQWFLAPGPPAVGTSPGDSTFGNGDHAFTFNAEIVAVPEPASAVTFLLLGMVGLAGRRRSQR